MAAEKNKFKPIIYVEGNRFDSFEDAVEYIIKDIPWNRSEILRRYIGKLLQEIEQLNKNLAENNSDCSLCYSKDKEQLKTAKELIKGMNKYLSTKPEFWSKEEMFEIVELSEKADQFVKQV